MIYDRVQPTKIAYVDGKPRTIHLRKARLVLHPGLPEQQELVFDQSVINIGTLEDNDVVLDDDTVSRYHCKIIHQDSEYLVVDNTSTNGTLVNGVRVREAFLTPGLILSVGNTQIRFSPLDEEVPVEPIASEVFGGIVGRSIAMREIFGILEKIAPTSATVIIDGETGTGKEVVARTIHEKSKRKDEPFIVFDCGAVPASLIESELFGHEKGSFTGAIMTRKGLFEMAQGGTIFLDELGELSIDLQPKLLRVLEQRDVRRVGSNKPIPIDVRVIAATNRDLEQEVKEGRFREDLFYRLSVVRVRLPALRERAEDVPILCQHFLRRLKERRGDEMESIDGFAMSTLDCMKRYPWPGNVRELLNIVERACSFCDGALIQTEDLPEYVVNGELGDLPLPAPKPVRTPAETYARAEKHQPFKEAKEEWIAQFERDYIYDLLRKHNGNISKAAREADIDRKYFRKLMSKHEIETDDL